MHTLFRKEEVFDQKRESPQVESLMQLFKFFSLRTYSRQDCKPTTSSASHSPNQCKNQDSVWFSGKWTVFWKRLQPPCYSESIRYTCYFLFKCCGFFSFISKILFFPFKIPSFFLYPHNNSFKFDQSVLPNLLGLQKPLQRIAIPLVFSLFSISCRFWTFWYFDAFLPSNGVSSSTKTTGRARLVTSSPFSSIQISESKKQNKKQIAPVQIEIILFIKPAVSY